MRHFFPMCTGPHIRLFRNIKEASLNQNICFEQTRINFCEVNVIVRHFEFAKISVTWRKSFRASGNNFGHAKILVV